MGLILKILAIIVVFGGLGLIGFSYIGDLSPRTAPVSQPVDLDVD